MCPLRGDINLYSGFCNGSLTSLEIAVQQQGREIAQFYRKLGRFKWIIDHIGADMLVFSGEHQHSVYDVSSNNTVIYGMKYLPLHRSAHAIHQLYLHLVFVTYRRENTLELTREADYRALFADICRRIGQKVQPTALRPENLCELIEFGFEANHVHLLVRYPTTITIAQLVQYLKGISSHEWPTKKARNDPNEINRLWSASYFAKTVGHMSIQQTKEYQRSQGKSADKRDLGKVSTTSVRDPVKAA